MATICCNGQSLHLQRGSSVASAHCCIGVHSNGIRGLDYHALDPVAVETHLRSDSILPPKVVSQLEANGQQWNLLNQQKRRRHRIICLFICLFVLLNVLLSVSACVLLLYFGNFPAASKSAVNQRTMCIPCSPDDSKADHSRRLVGTSKNEASKGYLCCSSGDGSDDGQMKELILEGVKQSLQERIKGENLYNLLNNPLLPPPINRYAAHVFLKFARSHDTSNEEELHGTTFDEEMDADYDLLRDWSSEGNAAFIRHGIEFNATSGHFKVKDAGIYVIYSRIVFEDNSVMEDYYPDRWPKDGQKRIFGHAISSYSSNKYTDLLVDEQLSACIPGGFVCYNSRIFSTLHLTKDSTVAIRVRRLNFVSVRPRTSYFGLYKID